MSWRRLNKHNKGDIKQFLSRTEKNKLHATNRSESAQLVDQDGCLPLHRAARDGNLEKATRYLRDFPLGVRVMDNTGSLPLHLAAHNASFDMVHLLVNAYPMSKRIKDLMDYTPRQIAEQNNATPNIIALLT